MKCLKVDEYIKRTASVKETELLRLELQEYVKGQPGFQWRTLFDRVIRACNHQLGVIPSDAAHICELVKLVKVALNGYDCAGADATQNTPFYMEKIVFHIVKKLSSLEVHGLSCQVAEVLHERLIEAQQSEDYTVLVRSSFSVLWNGLNATKDKTFTSPRDRLHSQMQALSFLLLLHAESDNPFVSKAPIYTQDAVSQFESSCEVVTKEDSIFLLGEMHLLFSKFWASRVVGRNREQQHATKLCLYIIFEIVLIITKVLCKAGHHEMASSLLDNIDSKVKEVADCQYTALVLGKLAVKIHSAQKAAQEYGQFLTEGARALRSKPSILGDHEANAVLEGCALVVWAVESSHTKALSGPVLLTWFSFLEEHQEYTSKVMKNSTCQTESNRLQQVLCFSIYQGFAFAYESMQALQLENGDLLDRVLLYCQASAGQMMTELHKLANENLCIKAVVAVSNLACGLYNRRLYEQAFILLEILCKELCKKSASSLSADRLSRPFMLVVQTSRRAGKLERALDWVILWLKALGDKMTGHMTEPVSLWVKTKIDAARNSEEDIRLRTLRDGFGPDVPEDGVMLCLLGEELRAYKEVPGDTAQERYNTLCDLLDICHDESSYTHLRAVYLCEMAQVVCFQDFSEQTDCTAVDFTHEALRLLEAEPKTQETADKLRDDMAHVLLWLYICTIENNLQEAIAKDKKQQELREQTQYLDNLIWANDFEYENKQKNLDSVMVYEGLHFSLDAQNKQCQPLEKALSEWSALLKSGVLPSVRNPKQTSNSIAIMAALFKLMGKPLMALEAYQLAIGLAQQLGEAHSCASFLCQSASLLLDVGTPEIALAQIEQAEKFVSFKPAEGSSSLSMLVTLLKAQYCYSTAQVERGVPYLCEVLKEANEQKQSKSWYLLRARTLQTVCSYLSLDTASLAQAHRNLIKQHGLNSPDTAIYESMKLFCSLLVTLVGKGLYGNNGGSTDVRFIDQGDNLALKWQLLSDLIACSLKMVSVRSNCGAINDARLQCLEALKLAIKLQALSQCAELLVVKAELELMQGEKEESGFDLDKVRHLLELCIDFSNQKQKLERKIKPRKGRPAQKPESPLPALEDDLKGILSTRVWSAREQVRSDQFSSPPLKALPRRWLTSLSHKSDCQCPCCSEPCLGRVTVRWAATRADLDLQLEPDQAEFGLKLHRVALARSKSISTKLGAKLAKIFAACHTAAGATKPCFLQDIVGRVYLRIALCGLDPRLGKVCNVWKVLDASLAFVDSSPNPVLQPIKAGLMATKALLSLITIASNKDCSPEELFSNVWAWKAPKEFDELKSEHKITPPTPAPKKESTIKTKNAVKSDTFDKTKKAKIKVVKPKIDLRSSSFKAKSLVPMTPVMVKSKSSAGELSAFDFNTVVPTLACTPVQRVKPIASAHKAPKTASKLHFQIYEESPDQDKARPVPAAPRCTRRRQFRADFSDESDSEANTQAAPKKEIVVPKTRTTGDRKSALSSKAALNLPAPRKAAAKKQGQNKRCTALIQMTSSEDEEPATRQGRSRRVTRSAKSETELMEEPDEMRTIIEEFYEVLDMSIEQLRASDTENDDHFSCQGIDTDFEVLRRDMVFGLEKDDLFELKKRGHLREGPQTHISHANLQPDDISLEDVKSLLCSAWLALQHFPSPTIYPTVCSLLALATGQQDPQTTAMLHAQSLGITSRHRTIRHLASCHKKLRKNANDLKDKMEVLTLHDLSPTESKSPAIQRLSRLENIFSFPTADTPNFPKSHCQEFIEQIQHIPPGVCVCVMSILGVKPGQMGDSILLSRLEKDSAPVTVHIPTSRQQHSVSWMVQEIDNIQVEQKVVSSVAEKAKWWEGRRALDSRVEELLKEMEGLLRCWKSLLLPVSPDPELSRHAHNLNKALSVKGVTVSQEMLKVLLSAAPSLCPEDLKTFAFGLCPEWDMSCEQHLQTAVSQLADREELKGHVVLILDKYLQKLPWENISVLRSRSVSRMPSLHSLIGLSVEKENDPNSILEQGVDAKKVFYVLDPDGNLENSKERFKEWFSSKPDWEGVCGVAPDSGKLAEAITSKDLYIYVGHGAGARFLDSQAVLKQQIRAASLLVGCSSAALAVRGDQEGQGIILYYLIAGCPLVLGNLWDVTDRDIDRFTKVLLESWLSAGPGAPLLDYMGPARQATHLKHLIGAAPVVYGLPIHLL